MHVERVLGGREESNELEIRLFEIENVGAPHLLHFA